MSQSVVIGMGVGWLSRGGVIYMCYRLFLISIALELCYMCWTLSFDGLSEAEKVEGD
jgi:4-hydroxybenzoate polyprenyltransferase